MKFILKVILTILFIPFFLMLIIGITVRFQILTPSFWQNTFATSGMYSKLSVSINKNIESRATAEGSKISDVKILTDLISPENLKDVIDKNIANVLQYANGKSDEIIIYVPVNKIPKSLLSKNFGEVKEQMKLADLLKEFNMIGVTPAQIQTISRLGTGSWLFLIIAIFISTLLLYLLYLLVDFGKRLNAPGITLILAGIVASLATLSGTIIQINWTKDLAGRSNMGDVIIGIVAPPVIQRILSVWFLFGAAAIILGIMLFFIKKPDYNKSK